MIGQVVSRHGTEDTPLGQCISTKVRRDGLVGSTLDSNGAGFHFTSVEKGYKRDPWEGASMYKRPSCAKGRPEGLLPVGSGGIVSCHYCHYSLHLFTADTTQPFELPLGLHHNHLHPSECRNEHKHFSMNQILEI